MQYPQFSFIFFFKLLNFVLHVIVYMAIRREMKRTHTHMYMYRSKKKLFFSRAFDAHATAAAIGTAARHQIGVSLRLGSVGNLEGLELPTGGVHGLADALGVKVGEGAKGADEDVFIQRLPFHRRRCCCCC